jgi:K+-transporting ATPase ATPase A chain
MEGKETRFGPTAAALFATVTTGTSTGAVNSMHDSFLPAGGLVPLFNIELGEITPGGVGAGLYGILVFAIIAVFIAGLMVGRTPEFLGKKIEAYEMKMAMLVVLFLAFSILFFTALATATTGGQSRAAQRRPPRLQRDPLRLLEPDRQQRLRLRRADRQHPLLQHHRRLRDDARAVRHDRADPGHRRLHGRQAPRRTVPGTFPTTGPIWVGLLIGVIIIVGALTFFPALALGPIVDQLLNNAGRLF